MFDNEYTEDHKPICPVCNKVLEADQGKTSGLYRNPNDPGIMVFAHHDCVKGNKND